ncbi:2-dehydro-3-deoxygalactonokinase [Guptibacillus hwajinpoensis]|uniref:2-dehydro-3-deoxygalactonokinase n=1 Tax=Guptibacillus hwajinpoensis TaxID=208199 RepID=A0ABU0JY91_9BACL|nr:2-dehydro-3-deoxygalactonokinase [Alkalihalobacillus hemicentroti]MDQ0481133.1 2-dehydro-3-deoxygalactonokinase [Alkalihalobacillus hemicentroti]
MYTITLDSGTTNTRATLWQSGKVINTRKREIGVKNTAVDGNNSRLKAAVKEVIQEVMQETGVLLEEIDYILASGMITSNLGIVEVPHLITPVTSEDLTQGIMRKRVSEIIEKDIWFIPGIKNNVKDISIENCEEMDVMRGEEVETVGLINRINLQGPALIILPGSHSKFVSINEENEITGCCTSLAGEMISVITHNTIIANSVRKSFVEQFNKRFAVKGFEQCMRTGLNRTLFTIRILDQSTDSTTNEMANFLLGAVLATDLVAIKNSSTLSVNRNTKVVVAGKEILRDAFTTLLYHDDYFTEIEKVESDDLKNLAGYGSICLVNREDFNIRD